MCLRRTHWIRRVPWLQGLYQDKPKLPFIPGSEVSGVITEVGSKVKSVKVGDRVIAITQTGAFAEQVVVHEAAVLKLPATVDLTAAAGGSFSAQIQYANDPHCSGFCNWASGSRSGAPLDER